MRRNVQPDTDDTQGVTFTPSDPVQAAWLRQANEAADVPLLGDSLRSGVDARARRDGELGIRGVPQWQPWEDGPPPKRKPSQRPATPLRTFHAYRNTRRTADRNTCGQAAIASILDFHDKNPFPDLTLTNGHWQDGEVIDRLKAEGWGPNIAGGELGTSGGRIRDALEHYGLDARYSHSGLFFSGWPTEWNKLLAYVYYSALPVVVCLDTGILGYPFLAHWAVVWKMTKGRKEMQLRLGNFGGPSRTLTESQFLNAWSCGQLPLGYNHAAIYTGKPKIWF